MKRRTLVVFLLVLFAIAITCHEPPQTPPWLLDWPEPKGILETREGESLILMFSVNGVNNTELHTFWWAWDNDPHSLTAQLQLTAPKPEPDGTFRADAGLQFLLSQYRRGDHNLKILLHNRTTEKNIMVSYTVHVAEKEQKPEHVEPEIIGVKVYPNWEE